MPGCDEAENRNAALVSTNNPGKITIEDAGSDNYPHNCLIQTFGCGKQFDANLHDMVASKEHKSCLMLTQVDDCRSQKNQRVVQR